MGGMFRMIPYVFLHIRKNGGTYFANRFRNCFDSSESSGWGAPGFDDENKQFIKGDHIPFGYQKKHFPKSYMLTILRDPIDRVVSSYYFSYENNSKLFQSRVCRALPLEELFTDKFTEIYPTERASDLLRYFFCNHQTRMIAGVKCNPGEADPITEEDLELAKSNLMKFSFVGMTHKMNSYWPFLANKFRLPHLNKYKNDNKRKNRNKARPKLSELAHSTKEAIRTANQYDLKLWDFVQENEELLLNLPVQVI